MNDLHIILMFYLPLHLVDGNLASWTIRLRIGSSMIQHGSQQEVSFMTCDGMKRSCTAIPDTSKTLITTH